MATILEVDGTPMRSAPGVSIYEVRFVPGTGWKQLDPEIQKLEQRGIQVGASLKPENYDLSVTLKPGITINRPYMAANMRTVTDVQMAEAMNNVGAVGVLHQFAPIEERVKWVSTLYDKKVNKELYPNANTIDSDGTPLIFAAVGFDDMEEEAVALVQAGALGIIFDSENGYTPPFRRKVERSTGRIKNIAGGEKIVFGAGNVATGWVLEDLLKFVDLAKVGIGSGVPCETPSHGAHIAQLGAIYETSKVARDMGKGIIYDGGAKDPFAFSVALAFAQLVMAGSYFAATEESAAVKKPGKDGVTYAIYQGSASTADRLEREEEYPEKYAGTKKDYRPSEGRQGYLPLKGEVSKVIMRTDRSVRLNMWYVGALDLENRKFTLEKFREYTVFQRMSEEALRQLNKSANFATPQFV